jgi:predicted phage terminase large subunit-like protein
MKKWNKLTLKFLAEENDLLNRKIGEQLWKNRFDKESVDDIKQTVGSVLLSALYQQKPIDTINSMFKSKYFKYFEVINNYVKTEDKYELIDFMQSFIVVDPAISESSSADYSAIMHFYIDSNNNYYINDIYRDRISANKLIEKIIEMHKKYDSLIVGVESVAFQKMIIELLTNRSLPLKLLKPKESKTVRAMPASAKLEIGKIYFRKADWNNEFEKELLAFPEGNHDDQVDCLAYATSFAFSENQLPIGKKKRNRFGFWKN